MKSLLAESPFLTAFILALIAIACLIGWIKTGSRGGLYAGLLALLLIPLAIWLAESWVTDREQIRETIELIAQHLENEEYDQVYPYIAPAAGALSTAQAELPRYQFETARVTGYRRIEVNDRMTPAEAHADFTVSVDVSVRGLGHHQRVPRRIRVAFRKSGEQWQIIGYVHLPPIGKEDNFTVRGGEWPTWIQD